MAKQVGRSRIGDNSARKARGGGRNGVEAVNEGKRGASVIKINLKNRSTV